MRRVEMQHNTPEQVREYMEEAIAIVRDLDLTGDLFVPAFTKAVDLLAAKHIQFEQVQPMGLPAMHIPRG